MGEYQAQIQQDEDGRWSSWIDELPGCAAWGLTREEALAALNDAAVAYIADMVDAGEMSSTDAAVVIQKPTAAQ